MSYEYIEHPSDILVLAKGDSFESTFSEVALAMFNNMGGDEAEEKESFDLEFSAPNAEQLVVQLLTEIIAECETRPLTPKRMEVSSFQYPVSSAQLPVSGSGLPVSGEEYKISVRIFGEKKIPENIIKAVTYNSLRVEKIENHWEIEILFDI
jgi:SHS2 domain-containing protein